MIPEELIYLTCKEFATYELAIQDPHCLGNDVIRYQVAVEQPLWVVDSKLLSPPSSGSYYISRLIFCRQLPNGYWAWVPEDLDDAAIVAERKNRCQGTEQTKYFTKTVNLPPDVIKNARYLADVKRQIRRDLILDAYEEMKDAETYRTTLIYKEDLKMWKIGYLMLYAKELPRLHRD